MSVMKRTFFLWVLAVLLGLGRLSAQINFIYLPEVYGRNVDGLANFQMQNIGGKSTIGQVVITVRENISKTQVLTVYSPQFTVVGGTSYFPAGVYVNSRFVFANSPIAAIASQTRNFPPGEYTYCFRFIGPGTHEEDENCFDATIEPLVPIDLIYPADQDKICQKRPPLSWKPPVPFPATMRFRLELTQKKRGSSVESLLMNAPLVLVDNIPTTSINYPSYAPDLQEDSTYCWQVVAFQNGVILEKSEIWEFTVQCHDPAAPASLDSYRELKSFMNGNYYYATAWLKFTYQNNYSYKKLHYEIYETENGSTQIKKLPEIPLVQGLNKIDIDLTQLDLEEGKHYMLKVYPFNEPPVVVRFEYHENNVVNP
jgi:hypothetical protein